MYIEFIECYVFDVRLRENCSLTGANIITRENVKNVYKRKIQTRQSRIWIFGRDDRSLNLGFAPRRCLPEYLHAQNLNKSYGFVSSVDA